MASGGRPSALFTASQTGRPATRRRSPMRRSCAVTPSLTSSTNTIGVTLRDRLLGLRGHFPRDPLGMQRFEPAGVDDDVVARADPAHAVMTIAREPREVRHQRGPRPRQAVEQGRLADIRSADDRNDGLHGTLFECQQGYGAVLSLDDRATAELARRRRDAAAECHPSKECTILGRQKVHITRVITDEHGSTQCERRASASD